MDWDHDPYASPTLRASDIVPKAGSKQQALGSPNKAPKGYEEGNSSESENLDDEDFDEIDMS